MLGYELVVVIDGSRSSVTVIDPLTAGLGDTLTQRPDRRAFDRTRGNVVERGRRSSRGEGQGGRRGARRGIEAVETPPSAFGASSDTRALPEAGSTATGVAGSVAAGAAVASEDSGSSTEGVTEGSAVAVDSATGTAFASSAVAWAVADVDDCSSEVASSRTGVGSGARMLVGSAPSTGTAPPLRRRTASPRTTTAPRATGVWLVVPSTSVSSTIAGAHPNWSTVASQGDRAEQHTLTDYGRGIQTSTRDRLHHCCSGTRSSTRQPPRRIVQRATIDRSLNPGDLGRGRGRGSLSSRIRTLARRQWRQAVPRRTAEAVWRAENRSGSNLCAPPIRRRRGSRVIRTPRTDARLLGALRRMVGGALAIVMVAIGIATAVAAEPAEPSDVVVALDFSHSILNDRPNRRGSRTRSTRSRTASRSRATTW